MPKKDKDINIKIVSGISLQSFFFDQFLMINKKFQKPLSQVVIYYLSLVMDKFGQSEEFFDIEKGRVQNKKLGLKILQLNKSSIKQQIRILKEVGDGALFLYGYFPDSVENKILNRNYYKKIGQLAYKKLNNLVPSFYEVDSFYSRLSEEFDNSSYLINIFQESSKQQKDEFTYIINKF